MMKRKYLKSPPARYNESKYWRTEAGEYIKVTNLPTSHLIRIIAKLRRNYRFYMEQYLMKHVMQLDLFDSVNEMSDREKILTACVPQYVNLIKEVVKRNENKDKAT